MKTEDLKRLKDICENNGFKLKDAGIGDIFVIKPKNEKKLYLNVDGVDIECNIDSSISTEDVDFVQTEFKYKYDKLAKRIEVNEIDIYWNVDQNNGYEFRFKFKTNNEDSKVSLVKAGKFIASQLEKYLNGEIE